MKGSIELMSKLKKLERGQHTIGAKVGILFEEMQELKRRDKMHVVTKRIDCTLLVIIGLVFLVMSLYLDNMNERLSLVFSIGHNEGWGLLSTCLVMLTLMSWGYAAWKWSRK